MEIDDLQLESSILLEACVRANDISGIQGLIHCNINVNAPILRQTNCGFEHTNALSICVEHSYLDAARVLLEAGATFCKLDDMNLMEYIITHDVDRELAKLLFLFGYQEDRHPMMIKIFGDTMSLVLTPTINKLSALGKDEELKILLNNTNFQQEDKNIALAYAAAQGHETTCNLLLESGAKPSIALHIVSSICKRPNLGSQLNKYKTILKIIER